jgi:hypothetical protein
MFIVRKSIAPCVVIIYSRLTLSLYGNVDDENITSSKKKKKNTKELLMKKNIYKCVTFETILLQIHTI